MDDTPKDVWRQGRVAGTAGRPLDANPHPAGAELALDWADGWLEGAKARVRRKPPSEPAQG